MILEQPGFLDKIQKRFAIRQRSLLPPGMVLNLNQVYILYGVNSRQLKLQLHAINESSLPKSPAGIFYMVDIMVPAAFYTLPCV